MQVKTNASDIAMGAVLLVKGNGGKWRPCAFLSHSFSSTEWNYPIYDKKLLAIIKALEEWHHYLIGKTNFEIWTDHKNLKYWKKLQTLSDH